MNPEKTKPISVFGSTIAGIFRLADGRLILQSDVDLIVVETDEAYWHSARISWEDLKDLTLSGNIISEVSFDPMNDDLELPFSYNVDTKELTGGSYQLYEISLATDKQRPWWKFWQFTVAFT